MTKENMSLYISLYESGKSIRDICDIHKIPWNRLYDILKNNNINVREETLIHDMYKNGTPVVKLGKELRISTKNVSAILKSQGFPNVGNPRRKYKLNEHYFDVIDNQDKAYILGFLYADGCNYKPKKTISMSLQEDDRDILEEIRIKVGSEKPLEYMDYSNKHDFGYTYKNQWRMIFFSSHMCDVLEHHGMIPNKSLKLEFPYWMEEKLIKHFIRGYFDGDGCVHFSNNGNCIVNITSTLDFCSQMKEYIENLLNIHVTITWASNHSDITKVFSISGKFQVKTFLDWLYDDANMYLERKHQTYINKYYNNSSHVA